MFYLEICVKYQFYVILSSSIIQNLMFMSKMFIYQCEVNGQTWIYFKYLIVQLLYEWYYAEENLKVVLE